MTDKDLAAIVERARCVLLDFDGPVCRVFANYSAPTVAAELRRVLVDQGVTVSDTMLSEPDPLEILRYTATFDRPGLTRKVDDALRAAELAAVRSAEPTPFAREVIVTAHQTGRRVAIVSNNSAEAVREYLISRRLAGYVHPVVGRVYGDPSQMKPNPAPLLAAVRELHADPGDCVLVGDSASDVQAAHSVAMTAIGYANKDGKHERLAKAEAIIGSMAELATALSDGEL